MAPDDGDVVATRLLHEVGGSMPATGHFVVHETASHWDVVEHRQLYSSTLGARRFEAMFNSGRNSKLF